LLSSIFDSFIRPFFLPSFIPFFHQTCLGARYLLCNCSCVVVSSVRCYADTASVKARILCICFSDDRPKDCYYLVENYVMERVVTNVDILSLCVSIWFPCWIKVKMVGYETAKVCVIHDSVNHLQQTMETQCVFSFHMGGRTSDQR
jgi:hypothetical protein